MGPESSLLNCVGNISLEENPVNSVWQSFSKAISQPSMTDCDDQEEVLMRAAALTDGKHIDYTRTALISITCEVKYVAYPETDPGQQTGKALALLRMMLCVQTFPSTQRSWRKLPIWTP